MMPAETGECRRERRRAWRGQKPPRDVVELVDGELIVRCPRCRRRAVGWPVQRADLCSPKDWIDCIRDPEKILECDKARRRSDGPHAPGEGLSQERQTSEAQASEPVRIQL